MNPRCAGESVNRIGLLAAVLLCRTIAAIAAQAGSTSPASTDAQKPAPEISTQESRPTFAIRVQHNEVMLRVVVRDSKGNAVTNLHQEDFRIFDRGKLQMITHFAVEAPGAPAGTVAVRAPTDTAAPAGSTGGTPPIILPTRYVGLFFDDIHLEFGDLARTRDAADKYLNTNLKPGDRAGVFTSSGQNQLAFTDDRGKLHDALMKIVPRPIASGPAHQCPEISEYQAYMIIEVNDPTALEVAEDDGLYVCCGGNTPCPQQSQNYIQNVAQSIVEASDLEPQYVFQGLERLCRILGTFVGQRSIVMVSPGFLTLDMTQLAQLQQAIDEALRENVVIGTIDARGLYADVGLGDASQQASGDPKYWGLKSQWETLTRSVNDDPLGSLADGTGGTFFQNNNDFAAAFRRAGGLPEAYYVLAFAPQDLKTDGRFHGLKVTLADNPGHFTLQTRKGYFAPTKVEDAATLAKEEMEQMVFSQEEVQPIPMEIRTQFFKNATGDSRLAVVTHVDISRLRFRKDKDRNLETLTMVTAVFDRAGSLVTAQQKLLDFHLLDSTLTRLLPGGLSIKSEATVKPGTYLVREVVQDSEGGEISALSRQVEIP